MRRPGYEQAWCEKAWVRLVCLSVKRAGHEQAWVQQSLSARGMRTPDCWFIPIPWPPKWCVCNSHKIIVCIISVMYMYTVLFIEDGVTTTKSLPNTNGTANSEETTSQQSLVASNGNRGLYSLVKADPYATAKEFHDSEEELIIDTHDIRSEFNILFSTVLEDLVSKGVDVRRFALFLKKIPGYAGKPLFAAECSKLDEASELVDAFEIVGNRCSWFNHSFLEQVIKMYCEGNKKTEKAHKAFCAHLKRYCEHRIRKCPLKNGFGSGGKKDVKIVMKVDREWDDIRIEQLEEVVFNVARILNVRRYLLMLSSVEQGCVQLTLVVPSYFPDAAFPLTSEQEAAMTEMGVTDLQCGSYHFSRQVCRPVY